MKLSVIALDYDGTIARGDVLDLSVRDAIAAARTHGIVVLLVTGRILDELRRVAGDLHFVDGVIVPRMARWFISLTAGGPLCWRLRCLRALWPNCAVAGFPLPLGSAWSMRIPTRLPACSRSSARSRPEDGAEKAPTGCELFQLAIPMHRPKRRAQALCLHLGRP